MSRELDAAVAETRDDERARCIALVCPQCAAGHVPTYTTAGTGGIQPEPRDWYHCVGWGVMVLCEARALYEVPTG